MAGESAERDADQPSLLDPDESRSDILPVAMPNQEASSETDDSGAIGSAAARPAAHPTFGRGRHASSEVLNGAVSSALWAAWADALGFISELATPETVMRRIHDPRPLPAGSTVEKVHHVLDSSPSRWPVRSTVEWRRRIGGRNGPTVTLPPGTYSDDTQLRLATSRCIFDGRFQPDLFAMVELPAFTAYGLGGGKATKAGAAAMTKGGHWAAPGHDGWASAGGNGVVMRAAPHGWAGAGYDVDPVEQTLDVIRNGVVTHGHPRALLPACLHALALSETLRVGSLPPLRQLHTWLSDLLFVPDAMATDPILGNTTLCSFEKQSKKPFERAWQETTDEMHALVDRFAEIFDHGGVTHGYVNAAYDVGLFKKATMGVGTATFVAAYWLAEAFQDDPITGILLAANAIGTDTDTIATIAGAHMGAARKFPPNHPLLDSEYIEAETYRVVAAHHPGAAPAMRYPDLDGWQAPKAQADYIGIDPSSGRVAMAGLGGGEWISRPESGSTTTDFLWQWFATDYGQSLPVKRRANLVGLPASALPEIEPQGVPGSPTVAESAELDDLRSRVARAEEAAKTAKKQTAAQRRQRNRVDPNGHDEVHTPTGSPATPTGERSTGATRREAPNSVPPSSHDAPGTTSEPAHGRGAERTLERAMEIAEARDFSNEIVGRLARDLAIEASVDEAMLFFGYVLAHWRRQAHERR